MISLCNKRRALSALLALFIFSCSSHASARLKIEITEYIESAVPIAVVPFAWDGPGEVPVDIAEIVGADLARSGQFKPLDRAQMLQQPQSAETIAFPFWKSLGMDHVVVGRVKPAGPGSYIVQFQLFNVVKEQQIFGYSRPVERDGMRAFAHVISDFVFEKLTGIKGAFNTWIAYVSTVSTADKKRLHRLQFADSDGFNPRTIFTSDQPLMSPAWSPDGKQLAYVWFEDRDPAIFVQTIATAERRRVSKVAGINGAPVWSPDGRRLAVTLSNRGNPDVYVIDVASGEKSRVTKKSAIDTEPVWTTDGTGIIFTSDRSGSPQLYEISATGGSATRLTREGKYNASPTVSPDGRQIAMVHRDNNRYRIAVLDRATQLLRVLTNGDLDESPSFAPNGTMIIYATKVQGRSVLGAVSADGRVKQRLSLTEGEVREPVWSPYLN